MIVELFGMSRAGKTTQKELLICKLEKNGLNFAVFQRPPKKFRDFSSLESFNRYIVDEMSRAHDRYVKERLDFLVYDRGFYDRIALLSADAGNGRVDLEYARNMILHLNGKRGAVDVPLMFIVSPKISLDRWDGQRKKGMDSTAMNLGLNTMDDLQGLNYLEAIYLDIGKHNPQVVKINGEVPIEETHSKICSVTFLSDSS